MCWSAQSIPCDSRVSRWLHDRGGVGLGLLGSSALIEQAGLIGCVPVAGAQRSPLESVQLWVSQVPGGAFDGDGVAVF